MYNQLFSKLILANFDKETKQTIGQHQINKYLQNLTKTSSKNDMKGIQRLTMIYIKQKLVEPVSEKIKSQNCHQLIQIKLHKKKNVLYVAVMYFFVYIFALYCTER